MALKAIEPVGGIQNSDDEKAEKDKADYRHSCEHFCLRRLRRDPPKRNGAV
jgi:hypothetical protein